MLICKICCKRRHLSPESLQLAHTGLLLALYFPLDPSDLACEFLKKKSHLFISLHSIMHAVLLLSVLLFHNALSAADN